MLIQIAQLIPFVALGRRVYGFARLLITFLLQQQLRPTQLIRQMLRRRFFARRRANVFRLLGNIGELGKIAVKRGANGGDELGAVGTSFYFLYSYFSNNKAA